MTLADWPTALQQLADAVAIAEAARYPQVVVDGGVWRGMAAGAWLARISAGASLLLAGRHAGTVPRVYGPSLSRRRVERRAVA